MHQLTGRSSEARSKYEVDLSKEGFSAERYARKWKARLDEKLEHKQQPI